jgi:hypothetical protein
MAFPILLVREINQSLHLGNLSLKQMQKCHRGAWLVFRASLLWAALWGKALGRPAWLG